MLSILVYKLYGKAINNTLKRMCVYCIVLKMGWEPLTGRFLFLGIVYSYVFYIDLLYYNQVHSCLILPYSDMNY